MVNDSAGSEGMSSNVAVHWDIADRLGVVVWLSSRIFSDGSSMNTEFEDWTWRS